MDSSERTAAGMSAAARTPLRIEDRDGEPSLFVPRWTTPAKVGRLVLLAFTVAASAGAVYAVVAAAWGWLILMAAVALVMGSLLVRDARKMPYDGGVWLTPTRIVHHWGGRSWTVGWDDVADLGIEPESGDVRLGLRPATGGDSAVTVSTHLLVISNRALINLVETLVDDPSKRAALGTEQARERAEEVRDVLDRPGFQPAVHNAPRPSAQLMFTLSLVLAAVVLGLAALGRAT